MKLSDRKWKDFYVVKNNYHDGLFKIENCKCGNSSILETGSDVFYIGAKKLNNGFVKIVKTNPSLISKGNALVFICDGQGSVGYTNYQENDFIGSTTLSVGYNDNLTPQIAQFIVSILDKERYRYSFFRKYRAYLPNTIIPLPVTTEGTPDWQFMEDYIASLNNQTDISDILELAIDESPERLIWLNNNINISDFKKFLKINKYFDKKDVSNVTNKIPLKLSDKKWNEFKLTDIFYCGMGNGIDASKIKTSRDSTINYVSRTSINNGVVAQVDVMSEHEPFIAGQLTLALGGEYLGSCFVQSDKFYTAQNVAVLSCKDSNISHGAKQFIATMIRNEAKIKYFAFGRELNSHYKTDFTIVLPVNTEGDPDYQFMDNYMSQIENSIVK